MWSGNDSAVACSRGSALAAMSAVWGAVNSLPSFIKRRDRHAEGVSANATVRRRGRRWRKAKSSAKRGDRGSGTQTLGPAMFPSVIRGSCLRAQLECSSIFSETLVIGWDTKETGSRFAFQLGVLFT